MDCRHGASAHKWRHYKGAQYKAECEHCDCRRYEDPIITNAERTRGDLDFRIHNGYELSGLDQAVSVSRATTSRGGRGRGGMCGENEPKIRVYRFENNGMSGPTEDSIESIIEDVRSELEHWADPEFGSSDPITLTITTGFMKRSEYDDLPEFEGY